MKGEIIAVEGVCCSGKTTIIRQLSSCLKTATVPELPEFGRNLFKPFTSGENILYNGSKSVGLEKIRMETAEKLTNISPYVLLDRSFISTLMLAYSAIDLIGVGPYLELVDDVLNSIENGELLIPEKVLYISVDSNTVQDRNKTRVPSLEEYWTNPERINRQNDFYSSLSNIDGIKTINGAQERNIVLEDCITSIKDPAKITQKELLSVVNNFKQRVFNENI